MTTWATGAGVGVRVGATVAVGGGEVGDGGTGVGDGGTGVAVGGTLVGVGGTGVGEGGKGVSVGGNGVEEGALVAVAVAAFRVGVSEGGTAVAVQVDAASPTVPVGSAEPLFSTSPEATTTALAFVMVFSGALLATGDLEASETVPRNDCESLGVEIAEAASAPIKATPRSVIRLQLKFPR